MKNALLTIEEEKSWLLQWKLAGVMLEQNRAEELCCLSDATRIQILNRLSSGSDCGFLREPPLTSGLVQQQEFFRKGNRK